MTDLEAIRREAYLDGIRDERAAWVRRLSALLPDDRQRVGCCNAPPERAPAGASVAEAGPGDRPAEVPPCLPPAGPVVLGHADPTRLNLYPQATAAPGAAGMRAAGPVVQNHAPNGWRNQDRADYLDRAWTNGTSIGLITDFMAQIPGNVMPDRAEPLVRAWAGERGLRRPAWFVAEGRKSAWGQASHVVEESIGMVRARELLSMGLSMPAIRAAVRLTVAEVATLEAGK